MLAAITRVSKKLAHTERNNKTTAHLKNTCTLQESQRILLTILRKATYVLPVFLSSLPLFSKGFKLSQLI